MGLSWLERGANNAKVAGSIPTLATIFFFLSNSGKRIKNHQKLDLARIRTWNLLIRSQTRYPLRHKALTVCRLSTSRLNQWIYISLSRRSRQLMEAKWKKGTDGVRTRELRFTRPTPYHLATAPAVNS